MNKNKVIIIIPCYNEEETKIKVCNKAKKNGKILVVDDNSKDSTKKKLIKKKINFISNNKNLGYESTVIKGLKHVLNTYKTAKYVATLDADLELLPHYIPRLIKKLEKSKCDIVIGYRNKMNRISEDFLNIIFFIKYKVNDPISGLKLYKTSLLKKIVYKVSNKLFLIDIIYLSIKYNFNIKNLSIKVNKRIDNPRVGGTIFTNIKILQIILKLLLIK